MSIKGYIVPLAVIGVGIAYYGVPKVKSQIREMRASHHVAPHVTIVQRVHDDASQDQWCRESRSSDARGWFCEVREFTLAAPAGVLDVDAGGNGGISVGGADRGDVLMRVRVQSRARAIEAAQELASMVEIQMSGDQVRVHGPKPQRRESWSASFRLSVPSNTDLKLKTVNGGIEVARVSGDITFQATNGGVSLEDVAGGVRGHTTNGGIDVTLAGSAWSGSGLDVQTTNGGIELQIPEDYNAMLEAGTVNGGLGIDFPITIQGKIGRKIKTQLGEGGPLVRAVTTNGGVNIRRR